MEMICSMCWGEVIWKGPFSALTHTECQHCGEINCQIIEESKPEQDKVSVSIKCGLPTTATTKTHQATDISRTEIMTQDKQPSVLESIDRTCPTAPEYIWLQVDPDCADDATPVYTVDDVTWCQDKINDSDTKYVRADIAQSQGAEIERLTDELRYIANADVVSWDDPSEFRAWAQNRARAAIIASEMQMLGSREGMGAPGGDSEGGSSFDDVDDDHDNCPF